MHCDRQSLEIKNNHYRIDISGHEQLSTLVAVVVVELRNILNTREAKQMDSYRPYPTVHMEQNKLTLVSADKMVISRACRLENCCGVSGAGDAIFLN